MSDLFDEVIDFEILGGFDETEANKELYGYEKKDIISLEFNDGQKEECGILGVFDVQGKEYIALNPLGSEDIYLYGYKEYDETYELIDIEDEQEFNNVTAEFEKHKLSEK